MCNMLLFLPFWLPPCIYFSLLDRAAVSSGVSRVAFLSNRYLLVTNGTVFPVSISQVLQVCLLYYMGCILYLIPKPWSPFEYQLKGFSLGLIGLEDWPVTTMEQLLCRG